MRGVLQQLYNSTVRPHLPRKIGVYNGVAVRYPHLFDMTDSWPEWKYGTVGAVRQTVNPGDHVIEVGTGFGVCSVVAARQGATVATHEASVGRVAIARETLRLNDVAESVNVNHAVVGEPRDVFGEVGDANTVSPATLSSCDVLVTDCEGVEAQLVQHLEEISPDRLVIETHGFAGAPTDEIATTVENSGYTIDDIVAPASTHADPEEDNKVVVAHL